MSRTRGRSRCAAQPAQPGHGQRQARHQAHRHHDGQDDPHQRGIVPGLRSRVQVQRPPGERQRDQEQHGLRDPAGRGHDGARAERHGRVVTLPLEEAHPGGEHGRGPAGQRAERVGHLDRHHPAEREHARHAADGFQRRRQEGQLGQHERGRDPEPVGPDHGVERLSHVDQHPDQRPAADQRADHHDQRRPAHPARLDQLGHVDRGGLGGPLPHVGQQPAVAAQAPAQRGIQPGLVQVLQRAAEHRRVDAAARRLPGPLGAGGRGGGRDAPGQVAVELIGRRVRGGVAEVGQHGAPVTRADQDHVTADRAVCDPGPAQRQQLPVQVVQRGVAHVGGVRPGQQSAGWQAADQQRVVSGPGGAGRHDVRHGHAGLARPHGEKPLVLDLLQPGQREAGPGVPVEQEPAQLGEQLGVRRVPAVHRDGQPLARGIRRAGLGGLVLGHPPGLPRQRQHVAHVDAEFVEQPPDIRGRGQAQR